LSELIHAANYLEIKELVELSCAKMAFIIKNLSIADFCKKFDISEIPDEN
jgi:hypothetical protein